MDITDKQFDAHFPKELKDLARNHWTPASIARRAAKFLVNTPETHVLDIGSGLGKFCIVAAAAYNDGIFTGVEQRENLCVLAGEVAAKYHLSNVHFIHANITEIDFTGFTSFFFYNSFYENIESKYAIDNTIELNPALFRKYQRNVAEKLWNMPSGTRLVTYWGDWQPVDFELVYCNGNGSLKFWSRK